MEAVLTLEPMADHPEMDSEHGAEEVLGEGQSLFLDMGPVGAAQGEPGKLPDH